MRYTEEELRNCLERRLKWYEEALKYKNEYKDALIKAMKYEDYNDMIKFYYSRIYDSIITLDINIDLIKKDELKRI